MLDDEVTLIDDAFYLVGRKDVQKPGDGTNQPHGAGRDPG